MLINHLLHIINTQNPIGHRFCTKCVRIIHLRSMFKRKNSVFPLINNTYTVRTKSVSKSTISSARNTHLTFTNNILEKRSSREFVIVWIGGI